MADANNVSTDEAVALLAEASCKANHGDCFGRIADGPCFNCERTARDQVKALEAAGVALHRVRWNV